MFCKDFKKISNKSVKNPRKKIPKKSQEHFKKKSQNKSHLKNLKIIYVL